MLGYSEQGGNECHNLAESDKSGRMDLAGRRNDKSRNKESTPYNSQQDG
ncbi:hypothetical protein [uncultured Duncaniella sp.]